MKHITGQIKEGWLGEDRSSSERQNGGTEYIMDVDIGPTCKLTFQLVARSLDEAKAILRTLLQWNVDWDNETTNPMELFWNETVPASHRSLSNESRTWLARYTTMYGEEKVKGAISTAAKRLEFVKVATCDDLTRYVGGILRNKTNQPSSPTHVAGVVTDTPSWVDKETPPVPSGPPRREDYPSRLDYARACYKAGVIPEPRHSSR